MNNFRDNLNVSRTAGCEVSFLDCPRNSGMVGKYAIKLKSLLTIYPWGGGFAKFPYRKFFLHLHNLMPVCVL